MQDKHLFEYAVLRIVPRIERDEFVNAGVILFCPKQRFLQVAIGLSEARVLALHPGLDVGFIRTHLESFQRICAGGKDGGPIGQLDLASRFRWLTAVRSTIVQTSRVHPGFCGDAGTALAALFEQMVG